MATKKEIIEEILEELERVEDIEKTVIVDGQRGLIICSLSPKMSEMEREFAGRITMAMKDLKSNIEKLVNCKINGATIDIHDGRKIIIREMPKPLVLLVVVGPKANLSLLSIEIARTVEKIKKTEKQFSFSLANKE